MGRIYRTNARELGRQSVFRVVKRAFENAVCEVWPIRWRPGIALAASSPRRPYPYLRLFLFLYFFVCKNTQPVIFL